MVGEADARLFERLAPCSGGASVAHSVQLRHRAQRGTYTEKRRILVFDNMLRTYFDLLEARFGGVDDGVSCMPVAVTLSHLSHNLS